jgi:hypothetical protein
MDCNYFQALGDSSDSESTRGSEISNKENPNSEANNQNSNLIEIDEASAHTNQIFTVCLF